MRAAQRRALLPHVEPHGVDQRDPVGILAGEVAAVNDIEADSVDRPPADAGLEARLGDAACFLHRAKLAEHFRGENPVIGRRAPVEAGAVGGAMVESW